MDNKEVNLYRQNFELRKEITDLKQKLKKATVALSYANNRIKQLEKKIENDKKNEEERIKQIVEKTVTEVTVTLTKEHEKEVNELNAKISRLEKRLNIDSSNSSTPTSKDRIGKHKIQNNREKSDKPIGAQIGHKAHKLEYFKEEEITETIEHKLETCPKCGGSLKEINFVISDIIDIEVKITKTRNKIYNYMCEGCKKKMTANSQLPRGVSYGKKIDAIGISMMNESNAALNKIASHFAGITDGEIVPTEGYFIKLQKRSAQKLREEGGFIPQLSEKVITLVKLFWDDTVVKYGLGKPEEGYDEKDLEYLEKLAEKKNEEKDVKEKKFKQGVIRFYGDDKWALLIGHRTKNHAGIDEDGILDNLTENCVVMHDHVLLNYNEKYKFQNAECNQHMLRYLKGNMETFKEHKWAKMMYDLLLDVKKEKDNLMENKITAFSETKLNEINDKYDEIVKLGYEENSSVDLTYILDKTDELNLIERLEKFKENHLMFATNFFVDFTNNTSERGLRTVKRKIAVSFMFKNANRAEDYATILSYLETCHRHGISRYKAAERLAQGNPYTVKELEELENDEKNEK